MVSVALSDHAPSLKDPSGSMTLSTEYMLPGLKSEGLFIFPKLQIKLHAMQRLFTKDMHAPRGLDSCRGLDSFIPDDIKHGFRQIHVTCRFRGPLMSSGLGGSKTTWPIVRVSMFV